MSEDNFWIVVGSRELEEGSVVEGRARQQLLEAQGAVLLPVDGHALHAQGAVASTAYQRRAYGEMGRAFTGGRAQRDCFLPVFLGSGTMRVEWVARLAIPGDGDLGRLRGSSLKLAAGALSGGPSCSVSESTGLDFGNPGEAFMRTSIARGRARVSGLPGSFAIVCLQGALEGVWVEWLAMTVLPP